MPTGFQGATIGQRTVDGWTDTPLNTAGGAVQWHVATAGNDTTGDGSSGNPFATPQKAYDSVVAGRGDQVFLNRGDTFSTFLTNVWSKGGDSALYPTVLGAYGTGARPKITGYNHSSGVCLRFHNLQNFAVIGVHIEAPSVGDPNPVDNSVMGVISQSGDTFENILFEDCEIVHGATNVSINDSKSSVTSPATMDSQNIQFRRNVVRGAYDTTAHSQGLFLRHLKDLLMEGNYLYHNGWHPTAGPESIRNQFNHGCYIKECHRVSLLDNWLVDNSAIGFKVSSDKLDWDFDLVHRHNFYFDHPVGLGINNSSPPVPYPEPHAVNILVEDCVMDLMGLDVPNSRSTPGSTTALSYCVQMLSVKDTTVRNCLFLNRTLASSPNGCLHYGAAYEQFNARAENNIFYNWPEVTKNAIKLPDPPHDTDPILVGNQVNQPAGNYPDPTRGADGYATHLAYASRAAMNTAALGQSRSSWDTDLTAKEACTWIKAGFTQAIVNVTKPKKNTPRGRGHGRLRQIEGT